MYTLTNVSKTYRQGSRTVEALRDVDLDIADGEFVVLQGQTVVGKSTLLQMLGALDKPSRGCVMLGDQDLGRLRSGTLGEVRAKRIGFVFQSFNLIPTLTALENVETALAPLGVSGATRRD